ncbi:MAG: efflux RND transporter periplasmic adaptor subunit [Ginsengibacter sp.]
MIRIKILQEKKYPLSVFSNKFYKVFTLAIFLISFAVILNSCGSKSKETKISQKKTANSQMNAPLQVEAYIVIPAVLNSSIDVAGTLLPFEETQIFPEVAGKVTYLEIKEGAFVKKGTLLAKLFNGDLQAQLQKLRVQSQIAEKTQQRQDQLLKIGGISQQDYDLSLLNVSSIKADIQVLEATINKTIIRAPFDGKIGFKNISIGAYVTPQTPITTIRQVNRLKLEFSVPEKYSPKVIVGNYINFTTETSSGKHAAKIIATESGITEDNRSLKVHAIVENVTKDIFSGGFASVNFDMGDNNQALMVPSQAIIPRSRDKQIIIYRGGRPDFTIVTTGVRDSANVEIIKGVAAGDTVVTTGLLSIKLESKLIISSIKK